MNALRIMVDLKKQQSEAQMAMTRSWIRLELASGWAGPED